MSTLCSLCSDWSWCNVYDTAKRLPIPQIWYSYILVRDAELGNVVLPRHGRTPATRQPTGPANFSSQRVEGNDCDTNCNVKRFIRVLQDSAYHLSEAEVHLILFFVF